MTGDLQAFRLDEGTSMSASPKLVSTFSDVSTTDLFRGGSSNSDVSIRCVEIPFE